MYTWNLSLQNLFSKIRRKKNLNFYFSLFRKKSFFSLFRKNVFFSLFRKKFYFFTFQKKSLFFTFQKKSKILCFSNFLQFRATRQKKTKFSCHKKIWSVYLEKLCQCIFEWDVLLEIHLFVLMWLFLKTVKNMFQARGDDHALLGGSACKNTFQAQSDDHSLGIYLKIHIV
jgi:hypothetical protein